MDRSTQGRIREEPGLLALEAADAAAVRSNPIHPDRGWSIVLGSDCHGLRGNVRPGARYTWVKMARPTLQGLRLALLDGNGVSIRRSDEGEFNPFATPAHFITGIEVRNARFMGKGKPETLTLTPFYNAVVGGRGTGKSTFVQALRLAYRRGDEVGKLDAEADPRRQFERFRKIVQGRDGDGALRQDTEINITLMREDIAHRLRWRQDGAGNVVEELDAGERWQTSASEAIDAQRFPIRLLSQGQIAAMAGDDREALLDIIDDAANVSEQHRLFEEAKRAYLSLCARLRDLQGRLARRQAVQRQLSDVTRKLEAFTRSHHADILKSHQRVVRQGREIEGALEQMGAVPGQIEAFARDLLFDDWPEDCFDVAQDAAALAWRGDLEQVLARARGILKQAADMVFERTRTLEMDERLRQWRQHAEKVQAAYAVLEATLARQGVTDPRIYGELVQERQRLEAQDKELEQLQQQETRLRADREAQWRRVFDARMAMTRIRADFVKRALQANAFVKMEVVPLGFDARVIEKSLRALLDVPDARFEGDILQSSRDEPASGLAFELAQAGDRVEELAALKQRMIALDESFGGFFRNYLERKLATPEFEDRILCWFPEDDLRIRYNRGGDEWASISEGSQGQRSAALLAFLLAFGDEPLVLDQPEDDLDNRLVYDLIVRQIRENKHRRQLIIVTHNSNVLVNGDAEMVHALDFRKGQCHVVQEGALQESSVREEVCRVMEGGREAFSRRWARLGRPFQDV